jgi:MYXO-CTERM domain-containing protein
VNKIDFSVPTGSTTLVDVTPSADFSGSLNLSAINGNIDYGCPSAAPSGANALWNSGNCGSQPTGNENSSTIDVERDNTIWNLAPGLFPTTDTLTVEGWQGTIVAPNQAVTINSNGQFEGSLFAESLSGGGQTDYDPFGGAMPSTADPLPALAEGLPIESGGLAVVGFVGLASIRRRRARAGSPAA